MSFVSFEDDFPEARASLRVLAFESGVFVSSSPELCRASSEMTVCFSSSRAAAIAASSLLEPILVKSDAGSRASAAFSSMSQTVQARRIRASKERKTPEERHQETKILRKVSESKAGSR